jgi:hypothetical protein
MATLTPGVVYPQNSAFTYPGGSAPAPTTPYSGTFIPTLWSGKLAQKFYKTSIFGEIANTDWQGEINGIGDKVIINTIPDLSITDYKLGGPIQYQIPEGQTIELVIDTGKLFAFQVNDLLELQSKPNLMNMFTDDATERMKLVIDKDVIYRSFFNDKGVLNTIETDKENVYDKIDARNTGAAAGRDSGNYNMGTDTTPVALTGANILEQITAMSSILDEANVPQEGRYLVISPYERHVLMQSNLAQAQFMGDNKSIIRNGKIGQIDRFTIYVSNQLPRTAAGKAWDNTTAAEGAAKRHLIFAGHKSAITFASQFVKTETLRNPQDFGDLIRGLNVYGTKVVKGDALVPMIIAG